VTRTLVIAALLLASCGDRVVGSGASASAPAIASPTPTVQVTKPPSSQPPLPAPTYTKWGIDRQGPPDRPYQFELYYDGAASGFRIVDAAGRLILQLPIAGSGIFGPDTCMVVTSPGGKSQNATWRIIDEATLQDLTAHGASYHVEVDTIGYGTITLPLVDTGCRR
jgi:hypothetical protein